MQFFIVPGTVNDGLPFGVLADAEGVGAGACQDCVGLLLDAADAGEDVGGSGHLCVLVSHLGGDRTLCRAVNQAVRIAGPTARETSRVPHEKVAAEIALRVS